MTQTRELPLFPLTAHILPGGRLRLRIFEARYSRLVKHCMAEQSPFVICMFDANAGKSSCDYLLSYGTLVNIVDFEMLDDGFLGITVEGAQRVKINSYHTEKDGLNIGQVTTLEPWPETPIDASKQVLKERLKEIFGTYPELGELYQQRNFDDLSWLCQRWLEILPLDVHTKQQLVQQESPSEVSEYLLQLVS